MTSRLSALAILLLLGVAACGDPAPAHPPPRPPAPKPAAAPAVTEEPKEPAPEAVYVYTPIGKRDPFQNVFAVKEVTKVKMPGRKPTPLQKWGIDQLKLSMTMTGTSSPFAMIETPDGRGYPVRVGDFVGQNWGKVTAVKRDEIIITESITDHATGRVYPSNLTLKIPKTEAEQSADELLKQGQANVDGSQQ
jgi:type IV pilus assembly protein PilP